MMLIVLFNILYNVMACLIILRRSRVGHPRVAIPLVVVVTVSHQWSFLTNQSANCCIF